MHSSGEISRREISDKSIPGVTVNFKLPWDYELYDLPFSVHMLPFEGEN